MTVAILLSCTTNLNSHRFKKSFGEQRIKDYVIGLNAFFKYNRYFIDNKIDIYFVDNNINNEFPLNENIKNALPKNVKLCCFCKNNYGVLNCGAGLLEQWTECKSIIEKYDYIIHFEPRQILIDNYFIENANENSFYFIKEHKQFWTGLFSISSKILLKYIEETNIEKMVKNSVCIENSLYDFFIKYEYEYNCVNKLNLKWHDNTTNKDIIV